MELLVVSPPVYFEGEAALFNQFFAAGLSLLHLRKPEQDALKFRKLMQEIDPGYYPQIVIHQHHDLAHLFSLERLHFKEEERKRIDQAQFSAMKTAGFRLSSSIHDLDVLQELEHFDYAFYGPVFNSISKPGYSSVLKADFTLAPHETKIFAIGGVTAGKLKQVKEMGFDGAGLLGAIWHAPDGPLAAFNKIQQTLIKITDGDC